MTRLGAGLLRAGLSLDGVPRLRLARSDLPSSEMNGGGAQRDVGVSAWGASSHVGYKEWASEALGEERQVYARLTTSSTRELVFLPDGAADEFRQAALSGQLVCPVPGCPSPQLTTRGPGNRRHHFVHRQAPPDPAHQRAYVRRVATDLIVEWIRSVHPRSSVEPGTSIGSVTAAAVVEGPTGLRFAVMFVDHRLGAESWWEADSELDRLGFVRGWIFAPRQFLRYPKPSSDARPDDPAVVDRRRGDIVLDRALFREMRALGRWPLLMNVTSREVANLVRPDGQVARRLQLRPPSSADRVLHLVPAPLSACRLCRDGIATPAVGADVLAAPRLAGEARKAASARVPESSTTPRWSPPPVASIRLPTQLNEVEVQGLSAARIHAAIDAAGGVTTLAALVRALQVESDAGEERLRSELYNLRIEGLIDFERPLGRFSAIRRPRRAVSGDQGSS